MKRNLSPVSMPSVRADASVEALEAMLPEMVRKLIARVEMLDQHIEHLDSLVRNDVGLIVAEQKQQRKTLETIKDLLTERLTQ